MFVFSSMLLFAVVDVDGGGAAVVPCTWFTGHEEDCYHWPPGRVNITKSVKDSLFQAQTGHSSECEIQGKQVMFQCFLSDNSDDIYVPTNYTFLKTSNILCMCFAANYADARQKLSKAEVNSDLQIESDLERGRGKRRRW